MRRRLTPLPHRLSSSLQCVSLRYACVTSEEEYEQEQEQEQD